MEQAAAAQMEADYDRAYAEFSVAHAASQPLVAALKAAQEQKAALQAKLDSLRAMAAQLEEFDPEWEAREKGECEALNLVGAGTGSGLRGWAAPLPLHSSPLLHCCAPPFSWCLVPGA
jgi:hypothetical protein